MAAFDACKEWCHNNCKMGKVTMDYNVFKLAGFHFIVKLLYLFTLNLHTTLTVLENGTMQSFNS